MKISYIYIYMQVIEFEINKLYKQIFDFTKENAIWINYPSFIGRFIKR